MAIYKPSLLDKFKDFVNGLRANWDEYENHVAEFESHKAESAKDDVHGLKPVLLWDGNVKNPNTTITLAHSIAEFSRVDLIIYASGIEVRTIYPHAYSEWALRPVNLSNNLTTADLYVYEINISIVSDTALKIDNNYNWNWWGGATSDANKVEGTQEIRRIYGIR